MNRAILVVICDFVVLSMLALNHGFNRNGSQEPFGAGAQLSVIDRATGDKLVVELRATQQKLEAARAKLLEEEYKSGFLAAREEEIAKLNAELAETRARADYLEKKFALEPQEIAAMTPEQLQRMLDQAETSGALNEARFETLRTQLDYSRERDANRNVELRDTTVKLAETETRLDVTKTELVAAQRLLNEREQAMNAKQAELVDTEKNLALTRAELTKIDEKLAERSEQLTGAREQIVLNQKAIEESRNKLQGLEQDLSYAKGQLRSTERDLAESRSRVEILTRDAANREIELAETKKHAENLENTFKNAVNENKKLRDELRRLQNTAETTNEVLSGVREDLASSQARLSAAEERLRSDVLDKYAGAVSRMNYDLAVKRLLMDHKANNSYYLPEVRIGDRLFLVGEFRAMTGENSIENGARIYKLDYLVSTPEGSQNKKLKAPQVLSLGEDNRVLLFEVEQQSKEPLKILTLDELKKRGIQDLFLFKSGSHGKETSVLDNRCSVSFESNDPYLYIRNSGRQSSELKAEPGDFVLTKQGEFVGVVVFLENSDLGRKQEAKCFVFPSEPSWDKATNISLQAAGSGNYDDFSSKINALRNKVAEFDQQTRQ